MMDDPTTITMNSADATSTEATPEGQQQPGEKLYAGKYKSVEELEKGYLEAQKVISSRSNQPANTTTETPETPTDTPPTEGNGKTKLTTETAQKAVTDAGLNWDALESEYADNGKLSDETYADLEKAGFPRERVDRYIAGASAMNAQYDEAVFGTVGGEENYRTLIGWANSNMTNDQKVAFNKAVESGNPEIAKLAVMGLASQYKDAVGDLPTLLNGKGNTSGTQGYKSAAEVVRAMRDSRYRKDPAYRDEVAKRLAVSDVF